MRCVLLTLGAVGLLSLAPAAHAQLCDGGAATTDALALNHGCERISGVP